MIYLKVRSYKLTNYSDMIVCISVTIFFSLAVSVYILLFINDLYSFVYKPLRVTVKYNVSDKIELSLLLQNNKLRK